MIDILRYVFDSKDFIARSTCWNWEQPWVGMYVTGNLLTFIAFFAMPTIFLTTLRNVKKLHLSYDDVSNNSRNWIVWTYAGFISFCGVGHFLEGVIAFTWPAYRFFAIWHAVLGLISVYATFVTAHLRLKWVSGL